jgi:hypothetical protein
LSPNKKGLTKIVTKIVVFVVDIKGVVGRWRWQERVVEMVAVGRGNKITVKKNSEKVTPNCDTKNR